MLINQVSVFFIASKNESKNLTRLFSFLKGCVEFRVVNAKSAFEIIGDSEKWDGRVLHTEISSAVRSHPSGSCGKMREIRIT